MRIIGAFAAAAWLTVCVSQDSLAQTTATSQSVPRLVTITGTFEPVDGQPARAVETITLTIYSEPAGGTALWQETQTIALDARGRYSLLLGATRADGIPADVFAAGAQWLATRFDRAGEQEAARVRLTMVPYAARSADADTLGGHPVSAFVLAPTGSNSTTAHASGTANTTGGASTAGSSTSPGASSNAVLGGTPNQLAKYVNATDVGDSAVYESAGRVGIGTTAPADFFHVRFTNPGGAFTGYAVQNMANTATSYSGMLFYDH